MWLTSNRLREGGRERKKEREGGERKKERERERERERKREGERERVEEKMERNPQGFLHTHLPSSLSLLSLSLSLSLLSLSLSLFLLLRCHDRGYMVTQELSTTTVPTTFGGDALASWCVEEWSDMRVT